MPNSFIHNDEMSSPGIDKPELSSSIKDILNDPNVLNNINIGNKEKYFRCPECLFIPQLYLSYLSNEENKHIDVNLKIKCEKKHDKNITETPIKEFVSINGPLFNIFETVCQGCNGNYKTLNIEKDSFLYCYQCEYFFCPMCHDKHKKEHKQFCKVNKFDYICDKHLENFTHFCPVCFKNMCNKCKEEDNGHLDKIKSINLIDIKKYENKLTTAKNYKETICDIIKQYIDKIESLKKNLIINFENFKTLNNYEIDICEKLIDFAKNKGNKKDNLNYFINQNIQTILNFNHLNINQLSDNVISETNIENILFYMNTFLSNSNNFILKNSYENLSLDNAKFEYENKDYKYYILNGILLYDGRIALGLTNSNINIYNNKLKKDFSILLPENENSLSLYQLSNGEILVGTNFGNIISYFIRNNEYIQHIKLNITELRIFKIINHPHSKKIIIAVEDGEIKVLNTEGSNYFIEEEFTFDSHHPIINVILNNNKLITLSRQEQEIRIWEYQNDTKKFKCIQNSIKVPNSDWYENVCNVDDNRIIVVGNSQANLINIKDFQIVNSLKLDGEFISICKMDYNFFLIGGIQKISKIIINDNKLSLVNNNKEISDIEGDMITKIFDAGNMGIIITTSRGIIKSLKF